MKDILSSISSSDIELLTDLHLLDNDVTVHINIPLFYQLEYNPLFEQLKLLLTDLYLHNPLMYYIQLHIINCISYILKHNLNR